MLGPEVLRTSSAAAVALGAIGALTVAVGGAAPVVTAVKRVKIAYGERNSQFGHVYLPTVAVPGPVPVIVLIHGGYWSTEFALTIETAIARDLAARGAVVWNIEYRRVGEDGGGWPRTGNDVIAAISALDAPVRYALPEEILSRIDWSKVAVIGHSAGGQLAVWATARLGARTKKCVHLHRHRPGRTAGPAGSRTHVSALAAGADGRFDHGGPGSVRRRLTGGPADLSGTRGGHPRHRGHRPSRRGQPRLRASRLARPANRPS